jgi:hypothetical protein
VRVMRCGLLAVCLLAKLLLPGWLAGADSSLRLLAAFRLSAVQYGAHVYRLARKFPTSWLRGEKMCGRGGTFQSTVFGGPCL